MSVHSTDIRASITVLGFYFCLSASAPKVRNGFWLTGIVNQGYVYGTSESQLSRLESILLPCTAQTKMLTFHYTG
jgi:hypothetical protein